MLPSNRISSRIENIFQPPQERGGGGLTMIGGVPPGLIGGGKFVSINPVRDIIAPFDAQQATPAHARDNVLDAGMIELPGNPKHWLAAAGFRRHFDCYCPRVRQFFTRMRIILHFAGLLLMASGFSNAAEIHVFAAASLTDVLKEIARAYEVESGDKVVFNFAGSNFLARQIEAGAPADVFFSADEAQMNALEKKNLVVTESRRNRLSNALVVVVGADSKIQIASARDLTKPEIKRMALADPAGVPAGIYAKQYLEKQNVWPALKPKIVPTENVRAALATVESGNVEAAIVYKTDATISKRTKVALQIPASDAPAMHYPIALLKDSKHPAAAKHFLLYVFSTAATAKFQAFGFLTE